MGGGCGCLNVIPQFSVEKRKKICGIARFAKRANELLSPEGLLGPKNVVAVWQKRSEEIELAIIAESARWGDYRRNVHPYSKEPYLLYDKNNSWLKEQKRLNETYFPKRSQKVLDQLKEIGLVGEVITTLSEENIAKTHRCFPNPFQKHLTFEFFQNVSGPVEINVLSQDG